jgi:hypothetical protein
MTGTVPSPAASATERIRLRPATEVHPSYRLQSGAAATVPLDSAYLRLERQLGESP